MFCLVICKLFWDRILLHFQLLCRMELKKPASASVTNTIFAMNIDWGHDHGKGRQTIFWYFPTKFQNCKPFILELSVFHKITLKFMPNSMEVSAESHNKHFLMFALWNTSILVDIYFLFLANTNRFFKGGRIINARPFFPLSFLRT